MKKELFFGLMLVVGLSLYSCDMPVPGEDDNNTTQPPVVDTTAPSWSGSFPYVAQLGPYGFNVHFRANEDCVAAYFVLTNNSPMPSTNDFLLDTPAGKVYSAGFSMGPNEHWWHVTTALEPATDYDVYIVVIDDATNVSVPVKMDVTTPTLFHSPEFTTDTVIFRYLSATATTVQLAGEMTAWNTSPITMTNAGGNMFVMELTLSNINAIGIVTTNALYKYIVDGNWIYDPANTNFASDGYGELNSIAKPM